MFGHEVALSVLARLEEAVFIMVIVTSSTITRVGHVISLTGCSSDTIQKLTIWS